MSCCSPHKKKEESSSHAHAHSSCCSSKSQPQKEAASSCGSSSDKKIDRHMTIEEILGMFPYKAQRLSQEITNAGLHCVGCHAAVFETLEAGMYSHGKTEEDITALVQRLNALLEEEIDLSSIRLTKRAADKFLEILEEEDKPGFGMRFSEEMAGCSGFEYVLDFSEKATQADTSFHCYGVDIHVETAQLPRLLGSEIDYVEGLRGAGFKISNPNIRSSCHCGTSHNY